MAETGYFPCVIIVRLLNALFSVRTCKKYMFYSSLYFVIIRNRPLFYAFIFHVDASNTNTYAAMDAEFTVVSPTVSFDDLGN